MTRWQSLGKLTIPAILLAILYHRPGNWAFEPTGRAHCSCSFREMSFHELTVELSAFDASLRMRGAIARGLSATLTLRLLQVSPSPARRCAEGTQLPRWALRAAPLFTCPQSSAAFVLRSFQSR